MQIVPKKYFLFALAALLVIAFGFMSVYLNKKREELLPSDNYESELEMIDTQTESTETEDIEKDLLETDVQNVDREMEDIEAELEIVL